MTVAAATDKDVVADLKARIDAVFNDLTEARAPFALLDFPNHKNIGDSAIWLGTLAFFESRGTRPRYVATTGSFREDRMAAEIGDGMIYFHGGGNFGDLWPRHQHFREHVLRRYPGRPVVQMPQTIYFRSQDSIDETARVIEGHGAFTLLVRDTRSLEFASRWFPCETRLCPDMAFCIGPLSRPRSRFETLLLLRGDQETALSGQGVAAAVLPGARHEDWPGESPLDKVVRKLPVACNGLPQLFRAPARIAEAGCREHARRRVARGIEHLGAARQVITDRMHGHILALLAGIPHCVLDNSYGKTSGFIDTWDTCRSADAHFATSIPEAARLLSIDIPAHAR